MGIYCWSPTIARAAAKKSIANCSSCLLAERLDTSYFLNFYFKLNYSAMEREMNSKFMAHVFKTQNMWEPRGERLNIPFGTDQTFCSCEPIKFSFCDLHDAECTVYQFQLIYIDPPNFSWFDGYKFIFTNKTNSMNLAVPSLFCPDERTPAFSRKSDLYHIFSLAPFHLQLWRPSLAVPKPTEVWFPPNRTQHFK